MIRLSPVEAAAVDDQKFFVAQQIVENIVSYAHQRGMKIIAEGLETPAELLKVLELDVDLLQGYFLAKPSAVPKPVSAESVAIIERFRKHLA